MINLQNQLSKTALAAAIEICEMEKENCRQIGKHGLKIIEAISKKKKGRAGEHTYTL